MSIPTDPAGHRVTCPACGRPLFVPPEAVGRSASCPHCRAGFALPANPDGSPGDPRPTRVVTVPRTLFGPALALLLLGLAGTLVNGYLTASFALRDGAALEFARSRVKELRGGPTLTEMKQADPNAPPPPAADAPLGPEEEALAKAWAPGMLPLHAVSTGLSVLTLIAGVCVLAGRFYWLALVGCLAAAVNVNHLCCIPGGLAGLWGVLSLARDDSRPHFRRTRPEPEASR